MVPEQPVIVDRICVVQVLNNLQFSTKVLKFGTLFLLQPLFVKSSCFKMKMQEYFSLKITELAEPYICSFYSFLSIIL